MRFPYIMAVATLALALAGCHAPTESETYRQVQQGVAIDGDTFSQANDPIHYRLARIDAPEMPGHCRPGRRCVPGDPYASQRALQYFLNEGAECIVVGRDVYHRRLVECETIKPFGAGDSINDAMMQLGFAEEYRR